MNACCRESAVFAVYRADVGTEVVVAVGCFSTGLLVPVSQLFMKCTATKLHVSIVFCYAACLSFPSPQRKMCSLRSLPRAWIGVCGYGCRTADDVQQAI